MTLDNDKLVNPQPFYALEMQHTLGHFGGGMVTIPDGRILYGVGDCLPYGTNGRGPSQDVNEHCGKILLIDPEAGTSEVAVMGVRNPQHLVIIDDKLMWQDVGGVSAEEVNAICLEEVLDMTVIENFGWGMRAGESFAREGHFKVSPGIALDLTEPKCEGLLSEAEKDGFYDPVMQFNRARTDTLTFYGISGMVVSKKSFTNFQILATEFNTGEAIVAKKNYCETGQKGYNITILNENDEVISSFNELNRDALGLSATDYSRGDGRMFLYPDGTAGLFMERSGHFYSLQEVTSKNQGDTQTCPCCAVAQEKSRACGARSGKLSCCGDLVCHKKQWWRCVKEENKLCAGPGTLARVCGAKWKKAAHSCCPGLVCKNKHCVKE